MGYPDDFKGLLPGEQPSRAAHMEAEHQARLDAARTAGCRAFSAAEDLIVLLDGDASDRTDDVSGMVSLAEAIESCVEQTRRLMRQNSQ